MPIPDNGGAAFPVPAVNFVEGHEGIHYPPNARGMSLRDYFAAKAMQAIIAKLPLKSARAERPGALRSDDDELLDMQMVSDGAYAYADAMIAASRVIHAEFRVLPPEEIEARASAHHEKIIDAEDELRDGLVDALKKIVKESDDTAAIEIAQAAIFKATGEAVEP